MTDSNASERAFDRSTTPVFLIVALLVAIHLLRQLLAPETDVRLLIELGFVPARFTMLVDPAGVMHDAGLNPDFLPLLSGGPRWWTWITYAFLHGSFAHIALNSVWLLAFGAAVSRRFGALRFVLFLVVTAICGALAHFLAHPYGLEPVIGASAAISGAMGAAVRFAFAPGAPLGAGFARSRDLSAYRQPAPPLRAVLVEPRAMTFLALWFAGNFLFGALVPAGADGTIAWEAHIGGFVAGFFLFPFFDPPPAREEP